MLTNISHYDFPRDEMILFYPINPKSIIIYMKDTITTLRFQFHNMHFSTYMNFLTSFQLSYIIHLYMKRVHYAYLLKTYRIHISSIHVSCKGHTFTKTTHDILYFITYRISFFESHKNDPCHLYRILYITI